MAKEQGTEAPFWTEHRVTLQVLRLPKQPVLLLEATLSAEQAVGVASQFCVHSQDVKSDGSHSNCCSWLVHGVCLQGCETLRCSYM